MNLIWYRAGVEIDPNSGESVLVDFAPMTTAVDVEGCSELVRQIAERDGKKDALLDNSNASRDASTGGDAIYFVCKHILRPNRRKSFERHARKVVSDMNPSRGDDGTLSFHIVVSEVMSSMNPSRGDDGALSFQMYYPFDLDRDADPSSSCHLIEHYRNSAAAAAHACKRTSIETRR
jgi:quinol monooxygenase YgiN